MSSSKIILTINAQVPGGRDPKEDAHLLKTSIDRASPSDYWWVRVVSGSDGSSWEARTHFEVGFVGVVVILDDTVGVWEKQLDNLVPLRPFDYFAGRRRRGKSLAQTRMDEEEASGAPAKVLDLLRRAHDHLLGSRRRRRPQGGVAGCLMKKPEPRARPGALLTLIAWIQICSSAASAAKSTV
ncbi:hypothetical protein Taro_001635 [Colocasia esculenta]|uniref:Uncharacterized protein n=1 Tax=Colocasia esculenta TaxID=4460 RepID=A0A843TE92_COLES|nr:hypothetical protein [Colocasia esculenta]